MSEWISTRIVPTGRDLSTPLPPQEAWENEDIPGLAINLAPDASKLWNVSHRASGGAVIRYLGSRRGAELAAEQLKGIADWTLPYEALNTKEISDAVIKVRRIFTSSERSGCNE